MNGNDSYDEFSLGNNYEPNISIIIPSSNNNVVNTSFDFELNTPFQIQNGDNNFLNSNNNSESSISLTDGFCSKNSSLEKIITGKKRGRKSKNDKTPGKHTKNTPDNMIKKIKTALINYIHVRLNKNRRCIFKNFLKLNKKINEYLKKDYNIKLMDMTIREIYEGNMLRAIYDEKIRDNKYNSSIIKEIFDENKDIETIKILNTKFIDFLNQSDTKENIFKIIKEKAFKSYSIVDAELYINHIRQHLEDFDNWFKRKPDRNYRHKKTDEEN